MENMMVNMNEYELNYAMSNKNDLALVLKLDKDGFRQTKEDSRMEFSISVLEDGYLRLELVFINLQNGTKVTLEVSPEQINNEEIRKELSLILEQDKIGVFIFKEDGEQLNYKTKVFENDKKILLAYLNGESINEPYDGFREMFASIPAGFLLPSATDVTFCFLCKTKEISINYINKNKDRIEFSTVIIGNELSICIKLDSSTIGSIAFKNNIELLNPQVLKDFNVFIKHKIITVIITDENDNKDRRVELNIPFKVENRKMIFDFMGLN